MLLNNIIEFKINSININIVNCHRIPKRSFFWRGKQLPLCARCTGINLGYLSYPFFLFDIFNLNVWLAILMIFPTYIDGFIQAYYSKESNNSFRFLSGLISGIGMMSSMNTLGRITGDLIKSIIN